MRWKLCRPYRIGVFRVFTRQSVVICQSLLVCFALLACIIFGNWLLTVIKSGHIPPDSSSTETLTTNRQSLESEDAALSYGIVVDCGSSGSRVFVYCWPPHTGQPRQLLDIRLLHDSNGNAVVMKIEPGLSSYVDNPSDSSKHIVHLLRYASVHIPKDIHKETPVYIMATAGLRLLQLRDQEAILNNLRVDLALKFDFLFSPTHVEVISGKQEGIYSWIAINHALGKFGHSPTADDHLMSFNVAGGNKHIRKRTIGILDLGGASLQIVYELPEHQVVDETDKNLFAEFNLGCSSSDVDHHYRLYVNTYLGLGSNEARYRYETQLLASYKNHSSSSPNLASTDGSGVLMVPDACLPPEHTEHIVRGNVTAILYGTGDLAECQQKVTQQLDYSTAPCNSTTHCPADRANNLKPTINFYDSEFYGFSEFYYTMEDILGIGGKYNSIQFQLAAQNYCATNWSIIEKWQNSSAFPRADANRYRLQCFKSAWLLNVLHRHLAFPHRYRHLTSVQYISGDEVHWTLGALLFKTKYYPLRYIEKYHRSQVQPHSAVWWLSALEHSYLTVVVCVAVICTVMLVYVWRISRVVRPLHRVPTMSYYMLDTDQLSDTTVHIDRSHSYSHLPYNMSSSSS